MLNRFKINLDCKKLLAKETFFNKYFFNMDISVTNNSILIKFCPCVDNIYMEGTVSQNFDIGPSFYFMTKKRETFCIFSKFNFLHFIKQKV